MAYSEREQQIVFSPLSPALRREYEGEIADLERRIDELESRRRGGDLSEDTRRKLHSLQAKLQAVEDRLDMRKRRNNGITQYPITKTK